MLNHQVENEPHAESIRGILFCKRQIRRLFQESQSVIIKRKALLARGVLVVHDGMEPLAECINGLRKCMFWLVRRYDETTIKPCLHERAQLLGVSHIALINHRAAIADAIGQCLDESLMTDVIQHGETAGERLHDSIWECTARDFPLFYACCEGMISHSDIPDNWLECFQDEMKASARKSKRAKLKAVV